MNITKQHPEFIFVHKQARLLFQIKLNITAMAKRSVLLLLVSIAVVFVVIVKEIRARIQ